MVCIAHLCISHACNSPHSTNVDSTQHGCVAIGEYCHGMQAGMQPGLTLLPEEPGTKATAVHQGASVRPTLSGLLPLAR